MHKGEYLPKPPDFSWSSYGHPVLSYRDMSIHISETVLRYENLLWCKMVANESTAKSPLLLANCILRIMQVILSILNS